MPANVLLSLRVAIKRTAIGRSQLFVVSGVDIPLFAVSGHRLSANFNDADSGTTYK